MNSIILAEVSAVAGHTLLTRDARRYRHYFPKLRIIAPEAGRAQGRHSGNTRFKLLTLGSSLQPLGTAMAGFWTAV